VADAFPDHPPYYAGATTTPAAQPGARVGVLPLYYQPGAAQPALFDPRWGPGTPLHALLSEMNATLDSLTTSRGESLTRLIDGARVSAVAPTSLGVPPDVMFGCLTARTCPTTSVKNAMVHWVGDGNRCGSPWGVHQKRGSRGPDRRWTRPV
jgi:hypothetical protein